MAITMIMVVIVVTFAGEKHRQEKHQTSDQGRSPRVTQIVGRKEGVKCDVAGEGPSAEVVGEDPKAFEAAVVGSALDVDRQEASEEHGRKD
jgi:hypothetical protein